MPSGLQVFNSNGTVMQDISTRTGRTVGVATYTPSAVWTSYYITVPRVAGEKVWAYGLATGDVDFQFYLVNDAGNAYDVNSNRIRVNIGPAVSNVTPSGTAFVVYGVA